MVPAQCAKYVSPPLPAHILDAAYHVAHSTNANPSHDPIFVATYPKPSVATRARHPPRRARGRSARATTHEDVFVDALVHALGAPALDRDDD